ncbi:TPA: phosphomannomutase [Candidatus Dependentiae bacterium]|nr:MAG: Phosphomannomutase/phosphoglucomutase [candidate division TM6 bacterium GW2011_GWE2_31_21]KKP53523.1 MAG: Phosphomannomutase/phosphoglucomutase [candidate division TM6 bacterium GW2011_GWF2_33_332]HBS48236.1 phosphomannomutase [Candidatus Dependentiae bacterium]HBZ73662.1 phosphomannomutase [Candidatus Dependentiae bacterium]
MLPNIFREYDIRGVIGKSFLIDEAENLAQSIVTYFLSKNPNINTVTVAMDGRIHSQAIKEKVINSITQMGINVIDIGLCPTPTFYFSLFMHPESTSGLMITASHNPKEYNGMKICFEKQSVFGKEIQEIKKISESQNFFENKTGKVGTVAKYDATNLYIKWLTDNFAHLKNLPISALIDCGNGTAGAILPQLISAMGWKNVKTIYEEIDGNFPNHEADPTTYENMHEIILKLKNNSTFELGIGFDGDCDRMSPITKNGKIVEGDKLLALFSKQILKDVPNATIVFDIKSSCGLMELLEEWGAKQILAPSGHSLIKNTMIQNNAMLAGELSCHFFFKHRYFGYDDGIYAMMRTFEILLEENKSLEELLQIFPQKFSSPEYRLTCKEEEKQEIVEKVKSYFSQKVDAKLITIDGIRAQLPFGWGLVRASNTQPAMTLRFEANSYENLEAIKYEFKIALNPYFQTDF